MPSSVSLQKIYFHIYIYENSNVKIKDGVLMLYTTSFADVILIVYKGYHFISGYHFNSHNEIAQVVFRFCN